MTFDSMQADPIIEVGFLSKRGHGGPAQWLTTEIAILKRLYATDGAAGVRRELPNRSLASIRAKASAMKIKCRRGSTTGLRFARIYPQRDDIDTAIREGYMHARAKGDIKALADRIGRPAWWVQKRASALALTRTNRTRIDCWKAEELAIIEQWSACTNKSIKQKLRAAGFDRTETAIQVKLNRMRLDREDPNRWSATQLAPLLGVNAATVADWVHRRGLIATRETYGPNGRLMIERKALRKWISTHPRYIDLRRVDQPWFMDLVLGAKQ